MPAEFSLSSVYRVNDREMTGFDLSMLLAELDFLIRRDILRSDSDQAMGDQRKAEICRMFGETFPDDVLRKFS